MFPSSVFSFFCHTLQVVMGTSLGEVAKGVIENVRFPLLDPEKLSQVEKENLERPYIPVSWWVTVLEAFQLEPWYTVRSY